MIWPLSLALRSTPGTFRKAIPFEWCPQDLIPSSDEASRLDPYATTSLENRFREWARLQIQRKSPNRFNTDVLFDSFRNRKSIHPYAMIYWLEKENERRSVHPHQSYYTSIVNCQVTIALE